MPNRPKLTPIGAFNSGDGASFGTGVWTTSAFTPPNDCLLVVFGGFIPTTDDASTGATLTIDDSGANLVWSTRRQSARMPTWSGGNACFTAPVSTGVSMQLQFDAGASSVDGYIAHVFAITDYDVLNPVGTSGATTDADGDGAGTLTLDAGPAPTSLILGNACAVEGAAIASSMVQGVGFDELFDSQLVNRFIMLHSEVQYYKGGTTVTWQDLDVNGGTNTGATLLGIEIRGAPDRFTMSPYDPSTDDACCNDGFVIPDLMNADDGWF